MHAGKVAKYLMQEAESLRSKNPSLSNYYEGVAEELSQVPQIVIGQRSGKLLEEHKKRTAGEYVCRKS